MTAPVTAQDANAAPDLSTQGASRKTYLDGPRDGMRVPMREVLLTTGDCVVLYDTSGPYTDANVHTDVHAGLASVREAWIAGRGDTAEYDGRTWHPTTTACVPGTCAASTPSSRAVGARAALSLAAVTQLAYARRGEITPEMEYVAVREGRRSRGRPRRGRRRARRHPGQRQPPGEPSR